MVVYECDRCASIGVITLYGQTVLQKSGSEMSMCVYKLIYCNVTVQHKKR